MCIQSRSMILAYLSSTRSNEPELEREPFPLPRVFPAIWRLTLLLDLLRGGPKAGGGLADCVSRSRYLCGRRARRGRTRIGESWISSPSTTCGTAGVGSSGRQLSLVRALNCCRWVCSLPVNQFTVPPTKSLQIISSSPSLHLANVLASTSI